MEKQMHRIFRYLTLRDMINFSLSNRYNKYLFDKFIISLKLKERNFLNLLESLVSHYGISTNSDNFNTILIEFGYSCLYNKHTLITELSVKIREKTSIIREKNENTEEERSKEGIFPRYIQEIIINGYRNLMSQNIELPKTAVNLYRDLEFEAACIDNRRDIIENIIDRDNTEDLSYFYLSVYYGYYDIARKILDYPLLGEENISSIEVFESTGSDISNMVLIACRKGHTEIVKTFVKSEDMNCNFYRYYIKTSFIVQNLEIFKIMMEVSFGSDICSAEICISDNIEYFIVMIESGRLSHREEKDIYNFAFRKSSKRIISYFMNNGYRKYRKKMELLKFPKEWDTFIKDISIIKEENALTIKFNSSHDDKKEYDDNLYRALRIFSKINKLYKGVSNKSIFFS